MPQPVTVWAPGHTLALSTMQSSQPVYSKHGVILSHNCITTPCCMMHQLRPLKLASPQHVCRESQHLLLIWVTLGLLLGTKNGSPQHRYLLSFPLGFLNALPDGVVFHRHHPRSQQLKLLLNLEPVAAGGHLDTVMENCTKWVALQRPAIPQVGVREHLQQPFQTCLAQACMSAYKASTDTWYRRLADILTSKTLPQPQSGQLLQVTA